MILTNRTKGVVICENVIKATSRKDKSKGLIGTSGTQGLLLETRWGIHTFGMGFFIDVIILNNKNIVVKIKKNLKPSKIFLWNPRHNRVIEIPSHLMKNATVEKEDELKFQQL